MIKFAKHNLKRLVKGFLVSIYSNIPNKIRQRWVGKKFPILMYHEISEELFETHLRYLKTKYSLISMEQLLYYKNSGFELPENSMIITFDDGWQSNYTLLPTIKKESIPVTIFLTTGLIGTNRKIWNFSIQERLGKNESFNTMLKNLPNYFRKKKLFEETGHYDEKEYSERSFLNEQEIKEMSRYVDFQSHGVFHPVFPMCSTEELNFEMRKSKEFVNNLVGKECYAIAYPYGRFNESVIEEAKNAGYTFGRIANKPALNSLNDNFFSLKSIAVSNCFSIESLEYKLLLSEVYSILRIS